jgi:hypothetical protein
MVNPRFSTDAHQSPFLKSLDNLRREAVRQGEYPEHVATIIAMVDQYAEAACGNRHYFCDEPYIFPPGKPIR